MAIRGSTCAFPGHLHANCFHTPDLGSPCGFQEAVSPLWDGKTGTQEGGSCWGPELHTQEPGCGESCTRATRELPLPCFPDSSRQKLTAKAVC